jgi:hypothetical protein
MDAYPNYRGGYKIQVHLVPVFDYFPGHKYNPLEAQRPVSPASWPVAPLNPICFEGMLTGELTYTAEMEPIYVNHMGPYYLAYDVTVPNMRLGGESSVIIEVDRAGGVAESAGYVSEWRYVKALRTVLVAFDPMSTKDIEDHASLKMAEQLDRGFYLF